MAHFSVRYLACWCLFFISCCYSLPSRGQSSGQGQVPDAVELAALQQFYESLHGENWYNKTNWLTGTTTDEAATWFGVTVENGDVTGLSFSYNNLAGELPASLGNLTQLKTIQFKYSQYLTGSLPPEIGHLSNLRELIIQYTSITGSIPPEVGDLHSLVTLNLLSNKFRGAIPKELGKLSKLQVFEISNYFAQQIDLANDFTGEIPPELGQLSELTYLDISLMPHIVGTIPAELGNLHKLDFLELDMRWSS